MKRLVRVMIFVLVAASLLSFCSCTEQPAEKQEETAVCFVDQAGRTVTLEKKAEKVVSCYYVTTYAMLSLGIGDKVVGIEKKADSRPIYAMAMPSLLQLPAVGTLKEINVEAIASLSPDLVILPKKLLDSASALEALGIPVMVVNPETEDDLREMLTLIGKACGAEKKAADLLAFTDEKIGAYTAGNEKPTVLCLGNSSYLTAAPADMYQNDLISLAGGENAYGNTEGNYWKEISYETLLALNPDYILLPSGASYTAEQFCADETLSGLAAVQNGHVLQMPKTFEEWDSPIPSAALGVLWLRSALHPSDYSSDSFRKDTVDFYETFYGFTPSAAALDSIG